MPGLLAVPVALAAGAWVFSRLDPAAVWRVARQSDALWLAASFVPLLLRFVVWGVKFGAMVRRDAPVPYADAARGVMAGAFLNLVTPTAKLAGGVYRAALLRRATGWRFSRAHGWILADQTTNLLGSLALFGVLAILAGPSLGGAVRSRTIVAGGIAALAVVAVAVLVRPRLHAWLRRPGVAAFLSRWRPLWSTRGPDDPDRRAWYESWLAPTLEGEGRRGAVVLDLALAALSWCMLCVSNALVFRSIGVDAPIAVLSVVLVVGAAFGSLSAMGGIGLTEAALVALYTQVGIGDTDAAAAALLHRASGYGVMLLWGGTAFARTRSRAGAPNAPEERPTDPRG